MMATTGNTADNNFHFTSSLIIGKCDRYDKGSGKDGCKCSNCESPAVHHKLVVKRSISKLYFPYLQAFVCTRNVRASLSLHGTVTQSNLDDLTESLTILEKLPTSGKGCNSIQLVESAAKLTKHSSLRQPEDVIRLIIDADDFYHQLFYCMDIHKRSYTANISIPSIPNPCSYFTEYAVDELQLNRELKTIIGVTFSSDYKKHIARIFGLDSSSAFNDNPLLQLHFARWRESLCFLSRFNMIARDIPSVLASVTNTTSSCHASMKLAGDPLHPPITRLWNNSCRKWTCHLYAFATPSPDALAALARYVPLVEVGAGTGYWAYCLRKRYSDIVVYACDRDPPSTSHSQKSNSYHGRADTWTLVMKGGVDVASRYKDATLLLCYPPPDSDMAIRAIKSYSGEIVCHVGELTGDTGTKNFETFLEKSFDCIEEIALPNWGDTSYSLTIWKRHLKKRKKEVLMPLHPKRCCVCGVVRSRMRRCRVTYSIIYCSESCASSDKGREKHLDELAYKFILFNPHSSESCANENRYVKETPRLSKSQRKRRRAKMIKMDVECGPVDKAVETKCDDAQRIGHSKSALPQPPGSKKRMTILPFHSDYFSMISAENSLHLTSGNM